MEKTNQDPLFSNSYKCADFLWGQSLGEGKFIFLSPQEPTTIDDIIKS